MMPYVAFSGATLARGIDLRKELDILFNVDKTAHWVVYRRFDLGKPSASYVELTREGVQGEKYEFVDELIDVRSSIFTRPSLQSQEAPRLYGLGPESKLRFYVRHLVNPKTSDIIYEFEYQGPGKPNMPQPSSFIKRYNILSVYPMRDAEYGRTEYFILQVEESIQ